MTEIHQEGLLTMVEDRRRFRFRRSGLTGTDEESPCGVNTGSMDGEARGSLGSVWK